MYPNSILSKIIKLKINNPDHFYLLYFHHSKNKVEAVLKRLNIKVGIVVILKIVKRNLIL